LIDAAFERQPAAEEDDGGGERKVEEQNGQQPEREVGAAEPAA